MVTSDYSTSPTSVREIDSAPPAVPILSTDKLPAWATALTKPNHRSAESTGSHGIRLQATRGEYASLISLHIPEARALDADTLSDRVEHAYGLIRQAADPGHSPARVWNFIPAITQELGSDLNRYMAFNVGRFAAMRTWFGDAFVSTGHIPTATGVGHQGTDLAIHALFTDHAPDPVENPRQCSAYRYTRRYGPRPPCFARATEVRIGDQHRLLIGGTASIRGEDSQHTADLAGQIDETIDNLQALLSPYTATDGKPLNHLQHARVYCPQSAEAPLIRDELMSRIPCDRLEFLRADLCRPELLVEIEGVAALGDQDSRKVTRDAPRTRDG